MQSYLDICKTVLHDGVVRPNRTGIATIAVPGLIFKHDMKDGFPLLTTKKMSYRTIFTELEFFIKGERSKKWLQDRKCHIWDEWCSPLKVPYKNDPETFKKMREEDDLGPVYGVQWRNFGETTDPSYTGVDQLKQLIDEAVKNPYSRRLIVSAWNPNALDYQALPPCHYCWQVDIIENKVNLLWNQRSVDVALGLPYNIASYACLLHLITLELNCKSNVRYEEGTLVGFLADTHIYENHVEVIKEQITRTPYDLPKIETNTENFSLFNWEATDSKIVNYTSHPKIAMEVAI